MNSSHTKRLLDRIAWRMRVGRAARTGYLALMILGGVYAAALLLTRFTGLAPEAMGWETLIAVPALALAAALGLHRAPTRAEAARAIDHHLDDKDLFLTAARIEGTAGEYQPLVLERAEQAAPRLEPARVVPWGGGERAGHAAVLLLALIAGVWWLPAFDPFGDQAQQDQLADVREMLDKQKEATVRRASMLERADPQTEHSKVTEQHFDQLRHAFNRLKPQDPQANLDALQRQQQQVDAQLRKLQEQKLADALRSRTMTQRFGGGDVGQREQWKNDLRAGKSESLEKAVDELKKQAEKLAKTDDPVERQKLQQQMKQQLKSLAEFAGQDIQAPGLSQALNQALEQLDASALDGLSQESLDALQQSLELSQLEAQQLAQTMRDMQSLQQALEALRLAQMANMQQQGLDGEQAAGMCQSLGDYAEWFAGQCQGGGIGAQAGAGAGSGGGMGGPGRGQGNIAPEDPTQQTSYQDQRASAQLQPGKVLLQWKSEGEAPTGAVQQRYREAMAQVQQGAAEAMRQEEVPPGYRDSIKRYFATLEREMNTDASDEQ